MANDGMSDGMSEPSFEKISTPWDVPPDLFCRINNDGPVVWGDDGDPIGLRVQLPDGRRMMLPFVYLPEAQDER